SVRADIGVAGRVTTSGDAGQGQGRSSPSWTRLSVMPVQDGDVEELRAALGRLPAVAELRIHPQGDERGSFDVDASSLGRLLYELEQVATRVGGVVTRTIAGDVVLALPSEVESAAEPPTFANLDAAANPAPRPPQAQLSIVRPSGWSPVDSA